MERYYGFDVLGVEEEQNVDGGIAFGTACLIIGGSVLLISAGGSAFNCFFRWSAIVAFLYTY